MPLLDIFWAMMWFFLWIMWIWLLIKIFADIFRTDMSGWAKAGWIIFVIILPFLGILIYLIANGGDMAKRDVDQMAAMQQQQKDYIQSVAGSSGGSADEIQKLAALKDSGALTQAEFDAQKAKLLA